MTNANRAKSVPKRHTSALRPPKTLLPHPAASRHIFCPTGQRMKHIATKNKELPTPHAAAPGDTASTLYLITGLGALTTAVGLMLCGRKSRALLVAQWVAPLLLAAVNERLARRGENGTEIG